MAKKIQTSLKGIFNIGDALPHKYGIHAGAIVAPISPDNGKISLIAPWNAAHQSPHTQASALDQVAKMQAQGFEGARLMTHREAEEIHRQVIRPTAQANGNAQFDRKDDTFSLWLGTELPDGDLAEVLYTAGSGLITTRLKTSSAYSRIIWDAPPDIGLVQ